MTASVNLSVAKEQSCVLGRQSSIPTLDDLLSLDPDRFVAQFPDVAAVNLACARGLPPTEEGEFPEYMALLATIAEAVEPGSDSLRC